MIHTADERENPIKLARLFLSTSEPRKKRAYFAAHFRSNLNFLVEETARSHIQELAGMHEASKCLFIAEPFLLKHPQTFFSKKSENLRCFKRQMQNFCCCK